MPEQHAAVAGHASAYEDMLETGDSSDAGSNGERLDWLNSQFNNCYTVIVKPSGQSAADFLAQRWTPRMSQWKSYARGGRRNATPTPRPARAEPEPEPEPEP